MSLFTDKDMSLRESQPTELYMLFSETEEYLYTNSPTPVTVPTISSNPFLPEIVKRGEISITKDDIQPKLKITLNLISDFGINNTFRFGKDRLYVKCFRLQSNGEYIIFYSGIVTEFSFTDTTIDILVSWSEIDWTSKILTYYTSTFCPHRLFGTMCGVNKEDYQFNGVIDAFWDTQVDIQSTLFGVVDRCYLATVFNSRTGENRVIVSHNEDNKVSVIRPFTNALVGDPLILTLGCEKTYDVCLNKFNNGVGFGGHWDIPIENPMSDKKIKRYS